MAKPDDRRSRAAGRGGMEPVDLPFVSAAAFAAVVAQPGGAAEDGEPAIEAAAARRHAEREVAELLASGLAVARTESGALRLVAVAADESVAAVAAVVDEMGEPARLARGGGRGPLQITDFDGMTTDSLRRSWFLQAPLLRGGGNDGCCPLPSAMAFSCELEPLYEWITDLRLQLHELYRREVEARYWGWCRWQMLALMCELARVLPMQAVLPICLLALPRNLPIQFVPPLLRAPPHLVLPDFMAPGAPWTHTCDVYEAQVERNLRAELKRLRAFKEYLRARRFHRIWFSAHPVRTRVFRNIPPGVEAQYCNDFEGDDEEDGSVSGGEPRPPACWGRGAMLALCGHVQAERMNRERRGINCGRGRWADLTPCVGSSWHIPSVCGWRISCGGACRWGWAARWPGCGVR